MSSSDEMEIRTAVVVRLRELLPKARIIHELNVAGQGSNRIDVAAITPTAIVAVEVKSKKDTLKRLDEQWEAFGKCCHKVIVAAHEKHFRIYKHPGEAAWYPGNLHLDHPIFYGKMHSWDGRIWRYPMPEGGSVHNPIWNFDSMRDLERQPRAFSMLNFLWAAELVAECKRHDLTIPRRASRSVSIQAMVLGLTGDEIRRAVCRQLRARECSWADAPIKEAA